MNALKKARASAVFDALYPQLCLFRLHPIPCECRLGPNCTRVGKCPAVKWRELTSAEKLTPDYDGQGYAIATGARSGIIVIDAIIAACGENADHGLRRTNEDKRRAVERLLGDPEWIKWSDRKIADVCRVSHPFVGTVRKELTGNVTSDVRSFVTKHGTEAAMNVANIGKVTRDEVHDEDDDAVEPFVPSPGKPDPPWAKDLEVGTDACELAKILTYANTAIKEWFERYPAPHHQQELDKHILVEAMQLFRTLQSRLQPAPEDVRAKLTVVAGGKS
jgi:hypothetical protein